MRRALILLSLAQFMLIVDITVVQVALPTIGTDLALQREALTWVVTTYTLCFGGLMVLGGRLADAFGARRVLLSGLAVFTLASLLCGFAANGAMLITGRALQGVGAALMSPSALAVITGTFEGVRRAKALAVWAAIGGSGAAVGVLLGGLLTAGPGWTWVFFINAPIGLLVLATLPTTIPATLTPTTIPSPLSPTSTPTPTHSPTHSPTTTSHPTISPHPTTTPHGAPSPHPSASAHPATSARGAATHGGPTHGGASHGEAPHDLTAHGGASGGGRRVDLPGAAAVTLATGLLIYGLVNAGDAGWSAPSTWLPLVGAVLGYAAFLLIERTVQAPLMRAQTLLRRPVLSGTFVMLLATGAMLALFFLSTLYLQHVLHYSPLETGLMFLPVAIAITLGAQVGGHLIGKLGGRTVAVAAFLITAGGALWMTGISAGSNPWTTLLPGFTVAAFGIGPAFVTATTTTMANVPPNEAGVASGVINTFHELGGSIGVAVVSTLAAASLTPGAIGISGFTTALTAITITATAAALISLALVPPGKPATTFTGHGH